MFASDPDKTLHQCQHCYRTITIVEGIVHVVIHKRHTYCAPCWDAIKPRWRKWLMRCFIDGQFRAATLHINARVTFNPAYT
jgi:hypothetical protein